MKWLVGGLLLIAIFPILIHTGPPEISRASESAVQGDQFYLFRLEPYANGVSAVADIAHAGDERLFVAQLPGLIRIIEPGGGAANIRFLDIRDRVFWGEGERGLVSLVFHPQYAENGYFFAVYTNSNGDSVVSRFQVTANPNIADPDSEEIILILPQPDPVHNVGDLSFGPDGYLYIAVGDGGPEGDALYQGQNRQSLYGTVLRIDVDRQFPYAIPPDNPFVHDPDARNEIFVYGLRNPWRINFDPLTHDLFIGDVGEQSYEELNYVPAGPPAGQNFGWSCYEGPAIFNPSQCVEGAEYTFPVYAYRQGSSCAIIAGPVYRGDLYPAMQGQVLIIDFCQGTLSSLARVSDNEWRTVYTSATGSNGWNTFGTDVHGEIYLGRFGPEIFHVTLVSVNLPQRNYLPYLP
jgi:glucose/arabinose dehydrogenase